MHSSLALSATCLFLAALGGCGQYCSAVSFSILPWEVWIEIGCNKMDFPVILPLVFLPVNVYEENHKPSSFKDLSFLCSAVVSRRELSTQITRYLCRSTEKKIKLWLLLHLCDYTGCVMTSSLKCKTGSEKMSCWLEQNCADMANMFGQTNLTSVLCED